MKKVALAGVLTLVLVACTQTQRPQRATTPTPTEMTTTVPPNPYADLSKADLDERLLRAASDNKAEEARLLLEAGADLETRDGHERTPLLRAVTEDSVEAAQVLADAGADPDALDDRHDTPWLVTGVTGSVAMAKVLLPLDPDLTIRNRYGGISHIPAGERGHDKYVEFVLDETDIEIDHVNDLGWTSLLEAVILGKGTKSWQNIVRSLVAHGADVSIADNNGVTALQHARAKGLTEITKILEGA